MPQQQDRSLVHPRAKEMLFSSAIDSTRGNRDSKRGGKGGTFPTLQDRQNRMHYLLVGRIDIGWSHVVYLRAYTHHIRLGYVVMDDVEFDVDDVDWPP